MRIARLPRAIGLALVLATVASCASSKSPIEIGFRQIALDLAFKDEELAEPIPPREVIIRVIEVEAPDVVEVPAPAPTGPRIVRTVRIEPPPAQEPCPTAPPNLAPERAAFAVVKDPPTAGLYRRHNVGTVEIDLAGQTTQFEVPAKSTYEITSVREFEGVIGFDSPDAEPDPLDPVTTGDEVKMPIVEFTVTRSLLPGHLVTDTYQYSNAKRSVASEGTPEARGAETTAVGDYLHLVRRVTVTRGEEEVFTPSPPIRLVRLNTPEGDMTEAGVVHSGLDPTTDVAMTVESQIVERELIDVCGEIFDTYRVEIKETIADLAKTPPETSGNEGETVNVWNVQFDNGLLILQESVNTTVRTSTELAGAPVPITVTYAYTSTLDSLIPEPLPEPVDP